ncbi:transposase [Pelagicoccus albus]|uniref:Transposase n=1 Tax=Pelagicoccus albus TaxID=415222 RepID=A0A7X1B2N6_9BACT|nr:transposase [Pelagicoccus albus]MBC2604437.1 transposase [Pelagicoccus albus]
MPRPKRIETNEGIFHVINRGNYRSYVFEDDGAKGAFETCLLEAAERSGWRVLAYCIMSNHFHLCLATPRGNLSEGMRWLQSTYAARYNRFRKEKGHLFQGRFKSLLVEPGEHLCDLVDYIHLNPVRARLVPAAQAGSYRWSSLYWLPKVKTRPSVLDVSWLDYRETLSDSSSSWRRYATSLQMLVSEDPDEIEKLEKRMCRGWCIGRASFKHAYAAEFLAKKDTLRLEGEALADLNESHWALALEKCLEALGETEASAKVALKSADWKLSIAKAMKARTSVTNAWLSKRLEMGSPRALSSNVSAYSKRCVRCGYWKALSRLQFDV